MSEKGIPMKTIQRVVIGTVTTAVLFGLAGCGGMSTRDQNTAVGAGAGAVIGGVLTGGSTGGVVGGAVVGGVIGHESGRRR